MLKLFDWKSVEHSGFIKLQEGNAACIPGTFAKLLVWSDLANNLKLVLNKERLSRNIPEAEFSACEAFAT